MGTVYINETQYFKNVPEIEWNFCIGGYQPAQKWLKDRKGRELSYEGYDLKKIMLLSFKEKILTPLIRERAFSHINNAWPCNAEPFMLYNSVKLKSLTRCKTKNAPL